MARLMIIFGIMLSGFFLSSGQSIIVEKHKDLMIQVSQEYDALMSEIKIQIRQTIDVTSSGNSVQVSGTSDKRNLIHIGNPVTKGNTMSVEQPVCEESSVIPISENKEAPPYPTSAVNYLPTIYPVKGQPKISSLYGYRKDPFTHKRAFHHGVDIVVPLNTPVHASGKGIISAAGYDVYGGKYVEVDHGNGYQSTYGHLSKILVNVGDPVEKGQLIGKSGSTGRSTGPHIHYQVSLKGKSVNPLSIIN